jgi:spermidine synthase
MLAALVLIPFAGTQRTFLAFAAALALVAALGLGWRFLALPAALTGALALPVGTIKAAGDARVLYERESALQYIRVVEEPDGDRVLELNEGQAGHSLYRPGSYLTGGYWDGMLVLPFTTLERPPQRVAILGNGAGTTARGYGRFFPRARVDGVEIDPELEEVGRRYFDMGSNPNLTVHNEDARPWLRRSGSGYQVIVVDSYRQPYVPFYLATREFFDLVRDRLAPGGVVVVNVGHPEGNDDLETVIGRTMSAVFPTVLRDPFDDSNTLLVGGEGAASAGRLRAAIKRLPPRLRGLAEAEAARVGQRLPGGSVYTDDRAPVEWLVDRSILGYAADR